MKKQSLLLVSLLFVNSFGIYAQRRDPNLVKKQASSAFNKKSTGPSPSSYNRPQYNSLGDVRIYAVVVGVGNYQQMPTLQYTDDDAAIFYDHLKSSQGGALPDNQIALLLNGDATRLNILNALRKLSRQADANDVFMFYFSGHGLQGSFLPVDFDGFRNQLSHEEILEILAGSQAKQKLCIADACFSGTLDYDDTFAAKSPYAAPAKCYYDAFENTDSGTALLMSSNPSEVSLEDRVLRHGVFTYFLMRGMNGAADFDHNQIVSIQELFHYVYHYVSEYTKGKQSPVLTGDYDNRLPVSYARRVK
jgi:Caspase domain